MATLADELRSEIMQQCKENTKSFLTRREHVINEIRSGKREVFFTLRHHYRNYEDGRKAAREVEKNVAHPEGYRLSSSGCVDNVGITYRNGKHFAQFFKKGGNRSVESDWQYVDVDDTQFWRKEYLYNREELLDLGGYFEREGFRVFVSLCSDYDARYPYTYNAFNIADLIVTL
jgi:hypothetical protein